MQLEVGVEVGVLLGLVVRGGQATVAGTSAQQVALTGEMEAGAVFQTQLVLVAQGS
jgi:hypothetical protein